MRRERAEVAGPYEFSIALRHLRSRNRNRFVSFIALISVVGIALSVAVLLVVLAVMNGFEHEVRDRILAVIPHASITGVNGDIEDWQALLDTVSGEPGVVAAAPFVEGQGMLVGAGGVAGVQLRGIDPQLEAGVSQTEQLAGGESLRLLENRQYRIILGQELAARLGVTTGDKVVLMTTQGAMTPLGLVPRVRRFEVAGIFYAGMYEFDRTLAYVHMDDAARLLGLPGRVSGVSLAVADPLDAFRIVRNAAREFGGGVYVTDWTRQHANFFRSLELTKSIIFVILLLVVAVAAFNIVSTLVMVVRDKAAEIAILRSMGATPLSILFIFITQGTLIGLVGTAAGLVVGLLVAFNLAPLAGILEALLGMEFVAPDVYFISELPSDVRMDDVVRIAGVAFLLAVVATIYPALKAALTNPAQALRHD